jgi:hypothetical protein
MKWILIRAGMAIVVSAVLGASATSATAIQLTYPTATKIATGTKLLWTTVGISKFTYGTKQSIEECAGLSLTGTLLHNGGEDVTAEVTEVGWLGTGPTQRCTTITGLTAQMTMNYEEGGKKVGVPYCLTTIEGTDKWEARGGSCGGSARSIKFRIHYWTLGEKEPPAVIGSCAYETSKITGTFTTDTGAGQDLILTTSEEGAFKRIELSSILLISSCPEETKFDASLTLETNTSTVDPVYAS